MLTAPAGLAPSPRKRKMMRLIRERGPGCPEHVAHVRGDREAPPDELRYQDRRLRERRHLVAEIRAADDGPRGRRLRDPITLAIPTNATPSVPAVVHELPVTMPTTAQIAAVATKKIARVEQPDAVVDDGRDRAGHVPRADQRADCQQDEDRAHRGRDAADRCIRDRCGGVAVLERHQARERG